MGVAVEGRTSFSSIRRINKGTFSGGWVSGLKASGGQSETIEAFLRDLQPTKKPCDLI